MSLSNSLIFIPDISGFTRFVNETAQEHSGHIIAELLEVLIDANQLDMTLAEIEGDALFYYKYQSVPPIAEVMAQIEQMFIRFHSHIKRYEHQRICQCGACSTAHQLTVKFIVHAGPIDFIQVKNLRKPYGKEIITAHRLMKNGIQNDEYVLFTHAALEAMLAQPVSQLHEALASSTTDQNTYEDIGAVYYDYLLLEPLKSRVSALPPLPDAPEIAQPFTGELFIPYHPEQLFQFIIDFKYRKLWNRGVDDFEYDEEKVNRAGTFHNCIIQNKSLQIETIKSERHSDETLLYGERTKDFPLAQELTTYFVLKPENGGTCLRLEIHPKIPNYLRWLLRPLLNRLFSKQINQVLTDLKVSIAQVYPSQSHSPPALSES